MSRKGAVQDMEIGGTYPMLYAFFDGDNKLRRGAFSRQISAALASDVAGISILGLGTEAAKLSRTEKRQVIDWVVSDIAQKVPVSVTISDGNVPDMIVSAKDALSAGASWIVLQPPRPPISGVQLIDFFGEIAGAIDCPVGIQNAPDFLGAALTAAELVQLNRKHPNVSVLKAESPALVVGEVIDSLAGCMKVFNGRAGLELTDNFRAGVDGMIPGIETIDHQVGVEKAMRGNNEAKAEALFGVVLPTLNFIMQGISGFLLYGKLIAALRLGIEPSANRFPADEASIRGMAWARRYAEQLGPLPG